MALLLSSGLDELIRGMEDIMELPEDVVSDMLNAKADVVVAAQKDQLRKIGLQDTRQLIDSVSRVNKVQSRGMEKYMEVYPQGTRENGVRNAEVGFIHEFGAPDRHIRAKHWMEDANEECADDAAEKAADVYEKYLEQKL